MIILLLHCVQGLPSLTDTSAPEAHEQFMKGKLLRLASCHNYSLLHIKGHIYNNLTLKSPGEKWSKEPSLTVEGELDNTATVGKHACIYMICLCDSDCTYIVVFR